MIVNIHIDGTEIDPIHVAALHQNDPFPGGHTFRLRLSKPGLARQLSLSPGEHSALSERQSDELFFVLAGLLEQAKSGMRDTQFFLNSIESAIITDDSIEFSGICSVVLSGHSAPE